MASSPTEAAPVFPQPVRFFAGRRVELDRIVAHVDQEILFFIYGVGGIGKSELAYALIRELRARPRWTDATPLLVEIRPDTTAARVLAQLLSILGAPAPRRGQPTEQAHLSEQLAQLAHALEERPYLLFIDDAHHLPTEEVAQALGYLSRRVQRSRVLVASRREIPLAKDAPPPVVTTLGPLDRRAAEEMMTALAERLQLPPPEASSMLRITHGSPFHIHRMLARHAPKTGSLEESFAELGASAGRLLRVASIAQYRPAVEMIRKTWSENVALDEVLDELTRRFLLEVKDGLLVVHDLVREALLGALSAEEISAAHQDAANLCIQALDQGMTTSLLLSVDALNHCIAAHRFEEAWRIVERWHSALAAAGSEHLLLAPLDQLRAVLPARRNAIDLLIARCLVRASLFDEATRVLSRVGDELEDAEAARYCVLAGEIAQRRGELERAEELFERAAERAPHENTRFQARLRAATAATLAADGDRTRRLLDSALAELTAPTARQLARLGWARTVGFMFDEQYERAAEEARRTRREMPERGLDDLANQLAMLETLACVEHEDMEGARTAARRIDAAGLRLRVASMYRAIVNHADANAPEASTELLEAHEYLRTHGDTIHGYLAGYHGAKALAEIGRLGEAQALSERTAELAERAGLRGPAARSRAQQALLANEALQSANGHRFADQALASTAIGPRARARAHLAHAQAYTIEGDIPQAQEHIELARAAVSAPELAAARAAIDIEHAAVDLVGGNLNRAVENAERAIEFYRGRSRHFEAAKARMVLSAAYIARGRRTDWLIAERTIAQARELADLAKLRSLQVGCAILSAAIARHTNQDRAALQLLGDALCQLDPERGSVYAGTLMAAIDGGIAARMTPGVGALLAHLGFAEAVDCYLVDRQRRRAATKEDAVREKQLRDLFVDESRAAIFGRRGEVEVQGRPLLCTMLAALIQGRGEPLSADTLYMRVWGVREYHPLRHRNALYVTLNRLRACLHEVFPERDVIERAGSGWRLADDVDACVAVPVRASP